jgi:two-component system LytT family response regulator
VVPMEDGLTTMAGARYRRLSERAFWGSAALLIFLAYVIVALGIGKGNLAQSVLVSFINLLSLVTVAVPIRLLLLRHVIGRNSWFQLALHAVLATAFSLVWYWFMMVLIGLSDGPSPLRFQVRPFVVDTAAAWQLLQGVTAYALLAALAEVRSRGAERGLVAMPASGAEPEGKEPVLSRYFIRRDDEFHPVDVSQIISITGADDYAEVATTAGRHLVRMTLSDFERTLESDNFIRVHRSRIVNVDRIQRAEPAGNGRMLLHMEDGEIVQASKTGARLLRDRVL